MNRKNILRKPRKSAGEIAPDEVLLDATNLPEFDQSQFEGRIEKSIEKKSMALLGIIFLIIGVAFIGRLWSLQVTHGAEYAVDSIENSLKHSYIFAERGVIRDRNGEILAKNEKGEEDEFSTRDYIDEEGFAHVLGYVAYPKKDSSGVYYSREYIGKDGVERIYNSELEGNHGLKIVESDVYGGVQSESVIDPPKDGSDLILSIDSRIQKELYDHIKDASETIGFDGGGGVIMDVKTGELLALASYPEYSPKVLSEGGPSDEISKYLTDERKPFLNRVVSGIYTPGSIIKPFIAIAALSEKVY